ncbi:MULTISPECIES: DnaJ C-terminal domain-containing protein [Mesorhizobium]|uniref:J domain-containing protein n=1 Tax=Mesorhizobium denitrificans TaxID=2294114 RepID=A0A371XI15_9HYPH|nr:MULTISPECIES: J domain-containing protein [Mesorhizobium]RFC68866.1 J domain-containing protein [Mesorhizobium denitrificans]
MRDPYEVLGVARTASAKDIKSAFRKLAKQYHPDQNPNDPKAKDLFATANQAYEILGDEKQRAAFDRGEIGPDGKPVFQGFESAGGGDPFAAFRQRGGDSHFDFRSSGGRPFGGNAGGDADDIFSQIFGDAFAGGGARPNARQRRVPRGEDVSVTLDISVEEMATAAKVSAQFPDGRKLAVKLPAFVEDGQTIRLKGQGMHGPGGAGDALVKIRLRTHSRYRVDGRDLHVDLPVSLRDAVLGATAPVETPTGRLGIKVPAWSSSDKIMRLKGKGLPLKSGGHGDLYVHVRIMLPTGGDPALEELLRKTAS